MAQVRRSGHPSTGFSPSSERSACPRFISIRRVEGLDRVFVLGRYATHDDGGLTSIGQLFNLAKYEHSTEAREQLVECMATWAETLRSVRPDVVSVDVVVPVPADVTRADHDLQIVAAAAIAQAINLPCPPLLRRARSTGRIKGTRERNRPLRLEGAFAASQNTDGRHVLLVDDLIQSGATMSTCAKELRRAGAKSVTGFAAVSIDPEG